MFGLLEKLGGKASIRQMVEYSKRRGLGKDYTHVVKLRDSLIRLKRLGIVSGNVLTKDYLGEPWTTVRKPVAGELESRKRRL